MTDADKAKFLEGYLATKKELQMLEHLNAETSEREASAKRFLRGEERDDVLRSIRALQDKRAGCIDANKKKMELCERAIASVQNDAQRKALELRCFDGLTWEDIADRLQYSLPQTYRIRRAALAAVQL